MYMNIKLEIGKSYPIEYVIKELEKTPEIQFGHILVVATGEHVYHVDKLKLEQNVAKKIERIVSVGGEEYKKRGKKFVPLKDIIILSIIDPYAKFRQDIGDTYELCKEYTRFYEGFFRQVVQGISGSKKGVIAASIDAVTNEAESMGFITKGEEGKLLRGMDIYFSIRKIKMDVVQNKYAIFRKG